MSADERDVSVLVVTHLFLGLLLWMMMFLFTSPFIDSIDGMLVFHTCYLSKLLCVGSFSIWIAEVSCSGRVVGQWGCVNGPGEV